VIRLVSEIKQAARRLGFEVAGITSLDPFPRDRAALDAWCSAGYAAEMGYMTRRPVLLANPRQLVPGAGSLITLALNYYADAPEFVHEHRYGRVARYAWGRDYHDVVKPRLALLGEEVSQIAGRQVRWRGFVDAVPLLERAAAARAGLGFFGKNTNLLLPRHGSWFFLADLFVDLALPADTLQTEVNCGSCRRCIVACPTDAFAAPYVLDSRRCISYQTIENRGPIPRDLRQGMGEWVFGCDVCQDVCPFNRFSSETFWPELRPESGAGPRLDLISLLSVRTNKEFAARFAGTALMRPRRRGLLRNAAIAAANIECGAATPLLAGLVEHDEEPMIRGHALWALARLDRSRARHLAGVAAKRDPDNWVREEAAACMELEV
jgi:epoxyqueuosine reductase